MNYSFDDLENTLDESMRRGSLGALFGARLAVGDGASGLGQVRYGESAIKQMKRHGLWVLAALSFAAGLLHPTPWCVDCETTAPFGHVHTGLDDVLQIWLMVVPLLAGLLKLQKAWLAPLLIVALQIIEQLVGGEPWLDFIGTEGPFIVLLGLPMCFLSLFDGYGLRYGYDCFHGPNASM